VYIVTRKTNAGTWETVDVPGDGGIFNTDTFPVSRFGPDGTAYLYGRKNAFPQSISIRKLLPSGIESGTLIRPVTGTSIQNNQGNTSIVIDQAGAHHVAWTDSVTWYYSIVR
jgi:hypothetical protein